MKRIAVPAAIVVMVALSAVLYATRTENTGLASAQQAPFGAEYVGSEACAECHEEVLEVFTRSGHAQMLNPVVNGEPPDHFFTEIPELPEGYTWDEISYVVGGYNWKAHFLNQDGYIITDTPGESGNAAYPGQYNLANPVLGKKAGWVTYHAGEDNLRYTCGACHTTGYDPSGENESPGIVGTWNEPGITCERCHGPGSLHVANPQGVPMAIERDSELCGECHLPGAPDAVNASGGFVQHHEGYEDLFQGKHAIIRCVQCHDPHVGVVQLRQAGEKTVRASCENCHFDQAKYQDSEAHPALLVTCIDCHMPRIIKSAWGDAGKFTGDIRTHIMAIDPGQVGQFTEDGSRALSQVSLDFACRNCHVEGGKALPKSDETLIEKATGYHERPQTSEWEK